MEYEAVIGLEVHARLLTDTKIFCGCANRFGDEPNSNVCPVCLGLPGALPVLNRQAVQMALAVMLATGCEIKNQSIFARKNYFYPDLPKGYQISQYEQPLSENGGLDINVNGLTKRIGITRIHMEEDAGKNLHEEGALFSLVDLNRCGSPLIEIVSEPDLRSPEEGAAYLKVLRRLLVYLGVNDGNLEEGSFRCDANISVRPVGQSQLGTRTELKNLNSFRFVQKALEYEVQRQIETIRGGGSVFQQTLLWDAQRGISVPMRSKEEAHDYRYFPDPDLLPLVVERPWIEEVRGALPELPWEKRTRFIGQYHLSQSDADLLSDTRETADYFEVVAKRVDPKTAANWLMVELFGRLNAASKDLSESPIAPEDLADLIVFIHDQTISGKMAKKVFSEMFSSGQKPKAIIAKSGLSQIRDSSEIEAIIDRVVAQSPNQVEQYKSGKETVFGYFMGQVMKLSQGKANPQLAREILLKKLAN